MVTATANATVGAHGGYGRDGVEGGGVVGDERLDCQIMGVMRSSWWHVKYGADGKRSNNKSEWQQAFLYVPFENLSDTST